jgi:hypothetical protein
MKLLARAMVDAFTFSAAFKRERGVAPSTVRA